MKRRKPLIAAVAVGAILLVRSTGASSSQDLQQLKKLYTRGITRVGTPTEEKKPGIQYVILTEGSQPVSSAHRFRSGDRFKLQFRVNQDSYVYILNRTVGLTRGQLPLAGSLLTRGIDVNPASKPSVYKLLYPRGTSDSNPVRADQKVALPRDNYFQMDQAPGEEKMIIVVSRSPIEIGRYCDIETGNCSTATLEPDLRNWNKNAVSAEAPDSRGIEIEPRESVGIAQDSGRPMVLVLDLIHLPD